MGTFDHLQYKRSTSSTSVPRTMGFLRPSRPFAPLSTPASQHVSSGKQEQPGHGTRVQFSLAHISVLPLEQHSAGNRPAAVRQKIEISDASREAMLREKNAFAVNIRRAARQGTQTPPTTYPFLKEIQQSFGRHDVSQVRAHLGPAATQSAESMRASAFASGKHVVFAGTPVLYTAAHEAAHIIQQRNGVQLADGIGKPEDAYERHADAVAQRVAAGQSAEGLLDQLAKKQDGLREGGHHSGEHSLPLADGTARGSAAQSRQINTASESTGHPIVQRTEEDAVAEARKHAARGTTILNWRDVYANKKSFTAEQWQKIVSAYNRGNPSSGLRLRNVRENEASETPLSSVPPSPTQGSSVSIGQVIDAASWTEMANSALEHVTDNPVMDIIHEFAPVVSVASNVKSANTQRTLANEAWNEGDYLSAGRHYIASGAHSVKATLAPVTAGHDPVSYGMSAVAHTARAPEHVEAAKQISKDRRKHLLKAEQMLPTSVQKKMRKWRHQYEGKQD